jgi:hypothetical protein
VKKARREMMVRMAWLVLWCWMDSGGGLGVAVVKSPHGVMVRCQSLRKVSSAGQGVVEVESWMGTSSGH